MSDHPTSHTWAPIWVLSALLVLFVGPIFGPVTGYAKEALGVRGGAGLVVALFTVVFLALAVGTVRWVRQQGEGLADLGWRHPTRTSAVVFALLWALRWGGFKNKG